MMNSFVEQLRQWPPTTSSVIGIGLMIGALDYLLTGSFAQAMFIAGLLKFLIPEDAAAAGQLSDALDRLSQAVPPQHS